jgi:hypothetical protein
MVRPRPVAPLIIQMQAARTRDLRQYDHGALLNHFALIDNHSGELYVNVTKKNTLEVDISRSARPVRNPLALHQRAADLLQLPQRYIRVFYTRVCMRNANFARLCAHSGL